MRLSFKFTCAAAWLITVAACASGGIAGQEATADVPPGDLLSVDNSDSTKAKLGQGDLVLVGRGFSSAKNAPLSVAVKDVLTKQIINDRSATYAVASDGSFQIVLPNQLAANSNYEVALYADKNGNGFCNMPPLDKTYVFNFISLATASVVTIVDTGISIPACGYFGDYDFMFDSQGGLSEGHPGHTVYGSLNDAKDNTAVGEIKYDLVASNPNAGQASFGWTKTLLQGHSYYFAICVDDNQNGQCDANTGSDHQFFWLENANSTTGIQGNTNETFILHHETNQLVTQYWPTAVSTLPPVYAQPPTLIATAQLPTDGNASPVVEQPIRYTAVFDANNALYEHNNYYCYAEVVDVTDPNHWVVVGAPQKQMVTKGALRLEWPSVLETEHSYIIAAFSDVKVDGICFGTAGAEPQWVIPLPFSSADATAYFAHQGRQASCLYFPAGVIP